MLKTLAQAPGVLPTADRSWFPSMKSIYQAQEPITMIGNESCTGVSRWSSPQSRLKIIAGRTKGLFWSQDPGTMTYKTRPARHYTMASKAPRLQADQKRDHRRAHQDLVATLTRPRLTETARREQPSQKKQGSEQQEQAGLQIQVAITLAET